MNVLILSSGSEIISNAYRNLGSRGKVSYISPIDNKFMPNIIRKLMVKFKTPLNKYIINYYLNRTQVNKPQKIIIFDSLLWENNIQSLREIFPNSQILYYYWNKVANKHKPYLVKAYTDLTMSFDKDDCIKYNFVFQEAFYSRSTNYHLSENTEDIDLSFVGLDKGRSEKIQRIMRAVENLGLNTYCHIVKDNTTKNIIDKNKIKNSFLSYDEYSEVVKRSRCILDVNMAGQKGNTIRVLESRELRKKLITNNVSIKSEPYYYRNNIFVCSDIMGYENLEADLREFLNLNYEEKCLSNDYSFSNWLKNIMEALDNDRIR